METSLIGLKEFQPDMVHLLYTEATREIYRPFVAMLPENVKANEYLIDPYEMENVRQVCRKIRAGLTDGDILQYNITEGTKVAAGAAVQVASEFKDHVVYYTQEGERIDFTSGSRRPVTARISNAEFVALFGNRLSSYKKASEIAMADVGASWDVKRFIESYQKAYQRIQHQFRTQFKGHLDKLPASFRVDRERGMTVTVNDGAMEINDRGRILFRSDNPNATRLFFTGRWWEVIVSNVVYKWDIARKARPSDSEVWRSVEFQGRAEGKVKNELDILVNDRRRLILIECKSGYIGQENVYKLDSTRETYGGDNSRAILVSYYPLDPDLVQKCRDLHVYYFAPEQTSDRIDHINRLPAWLDSIAGDIEPR